MDITLEGWSALLAFLIILLIPIVLITSTVAFIRRYIAKTKQRAQTTIVAQYEPPHDLSPAEVGYLFDSRLDKQEVIATLLDLEQRGYIDIKKIDGHYKIQRKENATNTLRPHEKYILHTYTDLDFLAVQNFVGLPKLQRKIRESLSEKGLIRSGFQYISFYARRVFMTFIVLTTPLYILMTVWTFGDLGVFGIFMWFLLIYVGGFQFFLVLSLISAFVYNRIVGHHGLWSKELKTLWPLIEGYRLYVKQVELDEINFESTELKIKSKNTVLPYAVALNLNTNWENRFK